MPGPLSAQHIAPSSGGFEPQRAYDFFVELYNLDGSDTIRLAVKDAFFPNGENGVIEINYFAENRKVAGKMTFPNGTITCHDYADENIAGKLLAWRTLVHDVNTGAQGYATEYKKEASIVMVDVKGQRERVFNLKGVWPASVTGSQLSYDAQGALEVSINLVYDQAIHLF